MFRCPRYPGIRRAGPDHSNATPPASANTTDARRPSGGTWVSTTSDGNAAGDGSGWAASRVDRGWVVITSATLQHTTDSAAAAQVAGRCQVPCTVAIFPGTGQVGRRGKDRAQNRRDQGVVTYQCCVLTFDNRALSEAGWGWPAPSERGN